MALIEIDGLHTVFNSMADLSMAHRIGLWENLQENPIFGKNHGFL